MYERYNVSLLTACAVPGVLPASAASLTVTLSGLAVPTTFPIVTAAATENEPSWKPGVAAKVSEYAESESTPVTRHVSVVASAVYSGVGSLTGAVDAGPTCNWVVPGR